MPVTTKYEAKSKHFIHSNFLALFLPIAIAHIAEGEHFPLGDVTQSSVLQTAFRVKGPGGVGGAAVGELGPQEEDPRELRVLRPLVIFVDVQVNDVQKVEP